MLTDKLFEFLAAALPIVAAGLVLAVLAAKHAWMKRNGEKTGDHGVEGMCAGMCAGLCLGTALGDIGTGISLGMLIGLAIGSCIKTKGRDESGDGE